MSAVRELPWWQALWKYSLFEAADSAWSLIVVSTYFGTFLQVVLGRPGAEFGWAITVASAVIALASPLLGAAADESGRRQPYLRLCVAGVVCFTAALSFIGSAWSALACFMLAYVSANAAFTFFTAMLPAVSDERNVSGIVSMTVGIGYVGGLVCITALSLLAPRDVDAARVFLPMAVIYLVFAFPAMFASPDVPRRAGKSAGFKAAYRRLAETFGEARKHRHAFRFLIGDFLYENAVASVITVMGLYARNVMGFSASELKAVFGPAIVVAALSAWSIFGPLTRKIGPKRATLIVLAIWLALFCAVLAVRPGTSFGLGQFLVSTKLLFTFLVAPLAGLGLAGVWTTSRVLLTALTPVEQSGEFWGLYNLSGRTATILGGATWSVILTIFGEGIFGYQIAIIVLALYVLLGATFIVGLPDVRPSPDNFTEPETASITSRQPSAP